MTVLIFRTQRFRTACLQAARGIAMGCAPAGNATSLCTDPTTGTVMGVLFAGSSRDWIDEVGPSIVEMTCPLTVLIG